MFNRAAEVGLQYVKNKGKSSSLNNENSPMQYATIFHGYKKNQMKNCVFFLLLLKTLIVVARPNEYPQSKFKSKKKKCIPL